MCLHATSAQNSELLARIDADSTLKPEEKQQQKEKIWNENTQRHVYDASGLKLSTAVRSSKDASDQLTYFYYDTERQLVLTIQVVADKQVQIREYTRDNFNNIVKTRDYSQVKATLFEAKNGRIDYVSTNMENPTREKVKRITDARWLVEVYHREIKQTCGIERCQARTGRAQRNHIFLAISAWVQQHKRRLTERITLYQQNWNIIKNAIQQHIKHLLIQSTVT